MASPRTQALGAPFRHSFYGDASLGLDVSRVHDDGPPWIAVDRVHETSQAVELNNAHAPFELLSIGDRQLKGDTLEAVCDLLRAAPRPVTLTLQSREKPVTVTLSPRDRAASERSATPPFPDHVDPVPDAEAPRGPDGVGLAPSTTRPEHVRRPSRDRPADVLNLGLDVGGFVYQEPDAPPDDDDSADEAELERRRQTKFTRPHLHMGLDIGGFVYD